MSSVRQIAAEAGVSVATVSRVLNNHPDVDPRTRDKILAVLNKAVYAPKVGRRITNVVGMVYLSDLIRVVGGAFDGSVLSGVLRGTGEHRFDVKVLNLSRDKSPDESYTQFFIRKGVRGVIIRTIESTRHVCEAIAQEGFPHVVVADRFDAGNVNYICCESRQESRRAVEHLIHLGHRRIGLALHSIRDTDHKDRFDGYRDALAEHGLEFDPGVAVEIQATMEGGSNAITRLLALPNPPTAMFFTDPLATLGGLRRCAELGLKVPQEFSIIGFDDADVRLHTFPSVTSVCQDAEALGFDAAQWLTRVLSGQTTSTLRQVGGTRLDLRQTTAAAPAHPVRIMPDGSRTIPPGDVGLE